MNPEFNQHMARSKKNCQSGMRPANTKHGFSFIIFSFTERFYKLFIF